MRIEKVSNSEVNNLRLLGVGQRDALFTVIYFLRVMGDGLQDIENSGRWNTKGAKASSMSVKTNTGQAVGSNEKDKKLHEKGKKLQSARARHGSEPPAVAGGPWVSERAGR
jgi:hypothetical protein